MKFKEYVENINKFLEEHPEAADMFCVYATDDDGNDYLGVDCTPTLMSMGDRFDVIYDGEPNRVCIN